MLSMFSDESGLNVITSSIRFRNSGLKVARRFSCIAAWNSAIFFAKPAASACIIS